MAQDMQFTLHVFSNGGRENVWRYIKSSRAYIKNGGTMEFTFPDIAGGCPFCGVKNCGKWSGYYLRWFQDTELGVYEPIAIRYGRCSWKNKRFSFLPDFLIPYRRLSKFSLCELVEGMKKNTLSDIIETFEAKFETHAHGALSVSTASEYQSFFQIIQRVNRCYCAALREPPLEGAERDLKLSYRYLISHMNSLFWHRDAIWSKKPQNYRHHYMHPVNAMMAEPRDLEACRARLWHGPP